MHSIILLVLPYLISIALRISTFQIERKVALGGAAVLVRPEGPTPDQLSVVAKHFSHASLRATAILTCFTSSFACFAALLQMPRSSTVELAVLLLFGFGLALIVWVYPQEVGYFEGKANRLWYSKGGLAVILFTFYDVALAAIVLYVDHLQQSITPALTPHP
jgi:hypothetical protein